MTTAIVHVGGNDFLHGGISQKASIHLVELGSRPLYSIRNGEGAEVGRLVPSVESHSLVDDLMSVVGHALGLLSAKTSQEDPYLVSTPNELQFLQSLSQDAIVVVLLLDKASLLCPWSRVERGLKESYPGWKNVHVAFPRPLYPNDLPQPKGCSPQ